MVSDALRLTVQFDKLSANIGEIVQCNVDAERIGFRGYGMLLAEIGLPPGAEVDRSSLEQAMKSSGWEIDQYDVLPDRVIVYLWPRAGGTKFSFTFKPRFGLKALSRVVRSWPRNGHAGREIDGIGGTACVEQRESVRTRTAPRVVSPKLRLRSRCRRDPQCRTSRQTY